MFALLRWLEGSLCQQIFNSYWIHEYTFVDSVHLLSHSLFILSCYIQSHFFMHLNTLLEQTKRLVGWLVGRLVGWPSGRWHCTFFISWCQHVFLPGCINNIRQAHPIAPLRRSSKKTTHDGFSGSHFPPLRFSPPLQSKSFWRGIWNSSR